MMADRSADRRETAEATDSISSHGPARLFPRAVAEASRFGWDIAISVVTLIVTALIGAASAVFGLFLLAFLDHRPPESCSAQGAVTAVGSALLIALLIGVAGLVATIVQLVRRKPAWPFALATLTLCAIAIFFGGVGYDVAVGG